VRLPALIVALAFGCSGPPPTPAAPSLVVVGAAEVVVDGAWMDANPSTTEWGEGRAWPLGPLLGSSAGGSLRVTPREGEPVVFEGAAARRDGLLPLLVVNRKGQAVVTLGDPGAGPGTFHGRGGGRERAGAGGTRVVDVVRVELIAGAPPAEPPPEPGPISVAGPPTHAPIARLTTETLAPVPEQPLRAPDGTPLGPTYRDLRAVSETLLNGARIARVVDGEGAGIDIPAAEWADPARVPALRVNKQGQWRFQWVVDGVVERRGPGVRGVTGLIVAP